MPADLPCPVMVTIGSGSTVIPERHHFAILLEWRQVADDRGVLSWRGLVVWALPGVGKAGSWETRTEWMPASWLRPIQWRTQERPRPTR